MGDADVRVSLTLLGCYGGKIPSLLGYRLADARPAMGVRSAAYRPPPEWEVKLLLHAVNYNVPLLPHLRGKTVESVLNLQVSLPRSIEWTGDSVLARVPVELLSPNHEWD